MTDKPVYWDDAAQKMIAKSSTSGANFVDEDFDATPDQTDFDVVQSFETTDVINVWVDGRKQREGASSSFTRNSVTNKIIFNDGLHENQWVFVRVYTGESPTFSDKEEIASADQTDFLIGQAIDETQTIDVEVDGRLNREGASYSYERDTDNNKIVFNSGLKAGNWVTIRVFDN